eukprot:11210875-Karenia_brevis.AAC.1
MQSTENAKKSTNYNRNYTLATKPATTDFGGLRSGEPQIWGSHLSPNSELDKDLPIREKND